MVPDTFYPPGREVSSGAQSLTWTQGGRCAQSNANAQNPGKAGRSRRQQFVIRGKIPPSGQTATTTARFEMFTPFRALIFVLGITILLIGLVGADDGLNSAVIAKNEWNQTTPLVDAAINKGDADARRKAIRRLKRLVHIGDTDQRNRASMLLYKLAIKEADRETARFALLRIIALNSDDDRDQSRRRRYAKSQLPQLSRNIDQVSLRNASRHMDEMVRSGKMVEAIETGQRLIQKLYTDAGIREARWHVAKLAYRGKQFKLARNQLNKLKAAATDPSELNRIHDYLARVLPADEAVALCQNLIKTSVNEGHDPVRWYGQRKGVRNRFFVRYRNGRTPFWFVGGGRVPDGRRGGSAWRGWGWVGRHGGIVPTGVRSAWGGA